MRYFRRFRRDCAKGLREGIARRDCAKGVRGDWIRHQPESTLEQNQRAWASFFLWLVYYQHHIHGELTSPSEFWRRRRRPVLSLLPAWRVMPGTNAFNFIPAVDVFRSTGNDGAYSDVLHVAANFAGTVLDEWKKLMPSKMREPIQFSSACNVRYIREAHRRKTCPMATRLGIKPPTYTIFKPM